RLCSKNTVVILVSDHGFKNGAGRPVDFALYLNERPAYWHREYGVFLISGPPARKNIQMDTVRVFDVAPTILYLLGLPVGKDLPGKVLTDALDSQFVTRFPVQTIPSWEPFRHSTLLAQSNAAIDSEVMENLSALGYIGRSGQ